MSHNPFISILVPVYNTELYLGRCIDSILCQSFTDFELLLIDDGSTDNSGAICDEYAEKDNRIRVFHKENGGVSSARNKGIKESVGKFLVFADSDDLLRPQHLEHLMYGEADLVITGLQQFEKGNSFKVPKEERHIDMAALPAVWNLPEMYYLYCYPVAKRYRTSIIKENNIWFDEDLFYQEDLSFVLSYLLKIDGFVELPFADYEYRIVESDRAVKFKMNAQQLIVHYKEFERLFGLLGLKCDGAFNYVKDNVDRRLLRSFYAFLQGCSDCKDYKDNARLFRKQEWSSQLMRLLEGRKEKRVVYGAYYCAGLSYLFENRAIRLLH